MQMQAHTSSMSFVGRENELAKIADLLVLPDCRLLTLTGPGGIGKTRLAIEAMAEQQAHFIHGVHFISLTTINSADVVASAVAGGLHLSFLPASDPRVQIIHYLRNKHTLLVLDNFEHVLEASDLLTDLLQAAPDVKCLVTSRERLNLREEWVLMLDGLPFPNGDANTRLESYSAVELFVQRARQIQANFTPSENVEAVRAICQWVEGMPLAIELAATWLRAMSCQHIAVHLGDSSDFLTTSLRNVPERHRSMRAVFEQSWNLLSTAEQHVLMYLSVFRGGFDHQAAEQVTGAALPVLASLVDKSMIRLNAAGRYDLHELLRQYAADKLAALGEVEAAHQHHCDYFLKLAITADEHAFGREQIPWFDRLEIELDNLRAAVFWSQNTEIGLRLAGALKWFFSERGYWREGRDWLERTLASNPDASPSHRARALLSLVSFVDDKRALALCDEAFSLAHGVNDRMNMAWALSQKGIFAALDPIQAVEILDTSLALFRQIDDAMGLAHTLVRRSWYTWGWQQDDELACALLQEAEMIAQKAGDKIIMGWVMHGFGSIAWCRCHLEQGRAYCLQGLAFFNEARFKMGYEMSLILGIIEQELGNPEAARTAYKAALLGCEVMYQPVDYLHPVLTNLSGLTWASKQFLHSRAINNLANNADLEHRGVLSELVSSSPVAAAFRDYLGEALLDDLRVNRQTITLEKGIHYLEIGAARIAAELRNRGSTVEAAHPQSPTPEPLTEREREILCLFGDGLNSREIAEQLVLSVWTIRWYLKHIYGKLDAHSRSEAIARAKELRLLT
jgi:predicted ATPase/DNA-binding CsgD family transcriptional regulator